MESKEELNYTNKTELVKSLKALGFKEVNPMQFESRSAHIYVYVTEDKQNITSVQISLSLANRFYNFKKISYNEFLKHDIELFSEIEKLNKRFAVPQDKDFVCLFKKD